MHISEFTAKVMKMVRSIPEGKVATYGQIAELAGKPQGSRGVGWILHSSSTAHKLPWHRVINSKGQISFEVGTHNFRKQKRMLEKEGVEFQVEGKLDLKKYQWKKKPPIAKKNKKGPQIFSD
jgi:methylated-DNA-protein-cysteine methyltransferase-like protein